MPTPVLDLILRGPSVPIPAGGIYNSTAMSGWSTTDSTVGTAGIQSPDGKLDAGSILEGSTAASGHDAFKSVTASFLAQATFLTVYAKRLNGSRNIRPGWLSSNFASEIFAVVDLTDGHVISGPTASGVYTSPTVTVSLAPRGWWKIVVGATISVDTALIPICRLYSSAAGSVTFNGDGVSSVAIWGVDLR